MSLAMDMAAVQLAVLNGNDFDIPDRFDGVPFKMPAGKEVIIPLDAAVHFFGFRWREDQQGFELKANREHVCRRYGWNTSTLGCGTTPEGKPVMNPVKAAENARLYFDNIRIRPLHRKFIDVPMDETLPEPREGAMRAAVDIAQEDEREPEGEIVVPGAPIPEASGGRRARAR